MQTLQLFDARQVMRALQGASRQTFLVGATEDDVPMPMLIGP